MVREELYKELMECLIDAKNTDKHKYGIFFLGSQLAIGKTRLYVNSTVARHRLEEYVFPTYGLSAKQRTMLNNIFDELIENKIIEIRKLGDRSPKFPYSIKDIDQVQADKLTKMLDGSDKELVDLALTILTEINKTK